jgi:nucleoside-diphosphate-sugar epimerase
LLGTLNVFEAAIQHGLQKVVYSSSAGVFGVDDGHAPRPMTHYGAFKLAAEGSARAYWEDHGFPSIGFRPYVVYGPGRESGSSAGPTLACRAAVRGVSYTVPFTGTAGFIYVEDVAAAFEAALFTTTPGAHVFNLAGEVATVEQVIEEIRRQVPDALLQAAGSPLPIAGEIAQDDVYEVLADLPRTSLTDGIAATIAHYRRNSCTD